MGSAACGCSCWPCRPSSAQQCALSVASLQDPKGLLPPKWTGGCPCLMALVAANQARLLVFAAAYQVHPHLLAVPLLAARCVCVCPLMAAPHICTCQFAVALRALTCPLAMASQLCAWPCLVSRVPMPQILQQWLSQPYQWVQCQQFPQPGLVQHLQLATLPLIHMHQHARV